MSHRQSSAPSLPASAEPHGSALLAAALAVLALVILPCVVSLLPTIYFDVDPRSEVGRQPTVALGPAGVAWYQVACLVVAAIAMAVSARAGATLRWGACALVAVGMIACAYHLPRGDANALHAGGWVAASALALAALHLGQFAEARRWMIAGMVAMLVPLGVQAIWYVLAEHPATVASYLATEADTLESRGWETGSAQHELYRRRVTDWQAVGRFGLSNVFGSVVAGFTMLGAAVTLGVWRAGAWRRAALLAAAVGLGAMAVLLSRSAGAVVGLMAGTAVLALAGASMRWPTWRKAMPAAAVALVVLAFAAVLVRGMLGPPETVAGERTVLFRFQYWQAAARIIGHDPLASALLGIGPAGFAEAYLWAKNPLNPEEVNSTHNVFIDYIVMLGLGGWALSAALLLWLWQAGKAACVTLGADEVPPAAVESPQPTWAGLPQVNLLLATAAALVFGVAYVVELPRMLPEWAVLWLAGVLSFIAVTAMVATRRLWPARWGAAGLLAAATVVLVHNQIEMTFFQFSAAPIVCVLVALAAAGASLPAATPRGGALRYVPAVTIAVAAVALLVGHTVPAARQQAKLSAAATALQQGQGGDALRLLDEAGADAPSDATVLRWRVAFRLAGARQAADAGRRDVAARWLAEALAVLQATAGHVRPTALHRHQAEVHEQAAALLGDASRRELALVHREQVVVHTPYSLADHVRLGDARWEAGDHEQAAAAYRRAIQISAWNYLDPARQLAEPEHDRLVARITEAGG